MDYRSDSIFAHIQQGTAHRLRTVGNRYFPNSIRRPFPKEHLEEVLSMDPANNERSIPPEDESIVLQSMWVVEFYTPAHIDGLLESLKQLGLKDVDDPRNPVSKLKDLRAIQYGTRWIRLGTIASSDEADCYIFGHLRSQLPAQVQYAYADIYCFTPSLIALMFKFVFEEEHKSAFQQALGQYRKSYVAPTDTGYTIYDSEYQKAEHIKQIRKETSAIVSEWVSNKVPGVFSAGLLNGDFPTCEFVTLRKAKPFPLQTERDETQTNYLWSLSLEHSFYTWESANVPGLRLDSEGGNKSIKHYAILSINESDWVEENYKGEHGGSIGSRIFRLHERMKGVLSVWAILSLLEGYADHFKELRRSAIFGNQLDGGTEEALQEISESLSSGVDISAVVSELASILDRRVPFGFNIEPFTPCSDWLKVRGQDSLWLSTLNGIEEYSKSLQAIDNSLPAQLTQYGNSLGLLENIRLQQRIKYLTYVITLLTFVMAALTLGSVFELPWSDIAEFMQRAGKLLTR